MKPKKIIIHCSDTKDSGTVSWGAIRNYHMYACGWSDIGYHYGIELVNDQYEILLGRLDNIQGAHCRGENHDSIGICFVGNYDFKPPTNSMIKKGVELVKHLMRKYGISAENVFSHNHFNRNKSCPGSCLDMVAFRKLLM